MVQGARNAVDNAENERQRLDKEYTAVVDEHVNLEADERLLLKKFDTKSAQVTEEERVCIEVLQQL